MLRALEGTCESDVGLVVLRDYLSQEISVGPSETRNGGRSYRCRDKERFNLVGEGVGEAPGADMEPNGQEDEIGDEENKVKDEEEETDAADPGCVPFD